VPEMSTAMPAIAEPVSDVPGGRRGLLGSGPLLREMRTSMIDGLMSAFDPDCVKTRTFVGGQARHRRARPALDADRFHQPANT
jgi:hypothetical protein